MRRWTGTTAYVSLTLSLFSKLNHDALFPNISVARDVLQFFEADMCWGVHEEVSPGSNLMLESCRLLEQQPVSSPILSIYPRHESLRLRISLHKEYVHVVSLDSSILVLPVKVKRCRYPVLTPLGDRRFESPVLTSIRQ